jgi:glycosyltransferase involved in cell wall biosynthesis
MLSLAPETIIYCPHGWYDALEYYDPDVRRQSHSLHKSGRYIFTSGRSYRDYATLARAVEGTDAEVRISSRSFNTAGAKMPPNVRTTGWLDYRQFQNHLYECYFYAVPLQPIAHAGGDSSILTAMSFGKAVVATRAPSTETYIQDGVTGLLVEPRDVEGMREAILRLWRNPDEAAHMGGEARKRFEENHTMQHLAQRIVSVAHDAYHTQQRQ